MKRNLGEKKDRLRDRGYHFTRKRLLARGQSELPKKVRIHGKWKLVHWKGLSKKKSKEKGGGYWVDHSHFRGDHIPFKKKKKGVV